MPPPLMPAPESTTMSPANVRLTLELMDAVLDEAKIVMKQTRPTPIISADAAVAVRLGLRLAFSRAKPQVMPRRRGNGVAMNRLNGSETVLPRTETPKKTSTAPAPTI